MAGFRRGTEAFEKSQAKGGSAFTPTHRWKAGEEKFIQFLTPAEDIPTVDFYPFIRVGENDATGKDIYREFISPRDAGLLEDNPDAVDYLKDAGVQSKKRTIALAVEVEPVYEKDGRKRVFTGAEVAMRSYTNKEGDEVEVPNVAFIVQSHIFFGWLFTFAQHKNLEDHIFSVTRKGGDQNTRYDVLDVGPAIEIDIPDEHMYDLDEYLNELADEERMKGYVEEALAKDPNWVFDTFAERGKSRPKRASRTVEAEAGSEDEGGEKGELFKGLRSRTKAASAA